MTLIERLEAATEGSRELDGYIQLELEGMGGNNGWLFRYGHVGNYLVFQHESDDEDDLELEVPHYTTSLDAAMTLVPEGVRVHLSQSYGDATWFCGLGVNAGHPLSEPIGDKGSYACRDWHSPQCKTPPLALCIAALRAREAQP